MKIIDFETIRKTTELKDYKLLLNWVDYALKNKSLFQMPIKTRLHQKNGNYFACMPCMNESENVSFVKMVGRHNLIDDEDKRSVMMSDILLYDSNTGILKALMDGEYITTLRTGVVAAHSALLFCKQDYYEIGLIGLGNIMTVFLNCFLHNYDKRPLKIKLYKHNNDAQRLIDSFKKYSTIDFYVYENYDDVIENSDLIVSAVTKVNSNFCEDQKFKKGCTVIPICTLGFQNCDLFFDKVFTDEIEQIRDFKYFDKFKSLANVSDVLLNHNKGREDENERIIVYNYGLAIHDLFFANKIYRLIETKEYDYKYCKEKYFME